AGWLLAPLLGAFLVWLAFVLGRELWNAPAGLVAAALVAVSPMAVLMSSGYLSHPAGAGLFRLFLWLAPFRAPLPSAPRRLPGPGSRARGGSPRPVPRSASRSASARSRCSRRRRSRFRSSPRRSGAADRGSLSREHSSSAASPARRRPFSTTHS